jgi:MFS family permease
MLTSITPLGERGKGNRWSVTATAYVLGSLVGGALLGLLGCALGSVVARRVDGRAALVVLAVACVAAAVVDLTGRRLPSWHRQVDEQWLQAYRGWVYGAGFGLQLGFGVLTIITSASTHVVVLATVLAGSIPGGVAIGATFGLVRGLAILSVRSVERPEQLSQFHRNMVERARTMQGLTVGSLLVGGVLLAVAGVGA